MDVRSGYFEEIDFADWECVGSADLAQTDFVD
jgi:hypothetical protein